MALPGRPRRSPLPRSKNSHAVTKPHPVHYLESADYERRTGGWIYNNKLVERLQKAGCEVKQLKLPAFFGAPDDVNEANFETALKSLPPGSLLMADNLYLMRFARRLKRRGLRIVSIFHHPISEERSTGGESESALEQQALSEAGLVICTSNLTARHIFTLERIDERKIVVAVPGVDTCEPSPDHVEGVWRFLSVGAVVPRKRYEFIIEALADLPDSNWQWTVTGNLTRYPPYVSELKGVVRRRGLDRNIAFAGEVEDPDLERQWRDAHVFLMSSTHEGYGMAVAEALAHGLPTITTMAGAVADWAADAVILVRSDDPAEMTMRIAALRNDRANYLAARSRALSFGKTLPTWDESLRHAVDRIRSLAIAD